MIKNVGNIRIQQNFEIRFIENWVKNGKKWVNIRMNSWTNFVF